MPAVVVVGTRHSVGYHDYIMKSSLTTCSASKLESTNTSIPTLSQARIAFCSHIATGVMDETSLGSRIKTRLIGSFLVAVDVASRCRHTRPSRLDNIQGCHPLCMVSACQSSEPCIVTSARPASAGAHAQLLKLAGVFTAITALSRPRSGDSRYKSSIMYLWRYDSSFDGVSKSFRVSRVLCCGCEVVSCRDGTWDAGP